MNIIDKKKTPDILRKLPELSHSFEMPVLRIYFIIKVPSTKRIIKSINATAGE